MSQSLRPDGFPIEVDGVEIATPGLTGEVEVHYARTPGTRAADEATPVLVEALDATGAREQLTIAIRDHAEEWQPPGTLTRSTSRGEPAIAVKVPGPGSGMGQVLLAADEDGVLRWVAPDDIPPEESVTRGGDSRTYTVPKSVVPAPDSGRRGLVGALGKKVLKVLAFKLIDAAAGAAAQLFASRWEKDKHPHRLRSFERGTYRTGDVPALTPAEVASLTGGPALLLVHGTMSVTHGAFRRLPEDLVQRLNDAYSGRVFAFDHPTVSVTPTENVKWLAAQLRDAQLTVDVLAHSRGGLVARVLAEHPEEAGLPPGALNVRKVVMVGTPNAGTALAHPQHLGELVDTWTNLLELVPDNAVTDVLAVIVSVVKQLAVGALGGLDGIMSMNPSGSYLSEFLNGPNASPFPGPGGAYFAVASNFEPAEGDPLGRFARDRVTDAIFEKAPNDLVVPHDGVFSNNGSPRFPIADPVKIGAADAIDHSSYWVSDPALKLFADVLKP
ncbi:MAG: hypothetical protein M3323_03785 [Actinomycetota bacterium]|nr:hypothetical protein [Actinomycetota bacterium]